MWAIFFTLCFISVIEVYSAGSYLTIKENSYFSPLFKQICYLGLAAITASVVQFIHFRYLSYLAIGGGVISIILLFFTLFGGQNINNGARWISIGGISFQPSELNKLCLIIYATAFTANAQKPDGTTRKISFLVLAPTFLSFGIIATQNLSTALMLVVSVFSILFIGNVPWRNFLKSLAYFSIGAVALLGAFWLYWGPNSTMTQRFTTWGSRLETRDERPQDRAISSSPTRTDRSPTPTLHSRAAESSVAARGALCNATTFRPLIPTSFSPSSAKSSASSAVPLSSCSIWGFSSAPIT